MTSQQMLFEDIFEVLDKDPDGRKFDKVSRVVCRSDLYEMDLKLDVNVDIYPLEVGDKFSLAMNSSLATDGTADTGTFSPDKFKQGGSLMDIYEYVMHGKIFKFQEVEASQGLKVNVFISFGGLLMLLSGDPKKLEDLQLDSSVYLLVRKV